MAAAAQNKPRCINCGDVSFRKTPRILDVTVLRIHAESRGSRNGDACPGEYLGEHFLHAA
jgi:hypothetical protein